MFCGTRGAGDEWGGGRGVITPGCEELWSRAPNREGVFSVALGEFFTRRARRGGPRGLDTQLSALWPRPLRSASTARPRQNARFDASAPLIPRWVATLTVCPVRRADRLIV